MTAGIELTVRDAGGEEGRGVARLPEGARRSLGVLSGDAVIVEGERAAVATVRPPDWGLDADAVALDARTRERAGLAVGDAARVRPERIATATTITVRIEGRPPESGVRASIREALAGRPIRTGDELAVDGAPATVVGTRPEGTVTVTDDTAIELREGSPGEVPATPDTEDAARRAGATYDDIGGLDEELELVREAVELPLAEPETFDRLGIEPPTGVLLYGPPGTGKTLIAEAVATATDATFYHVSGPEITSKYKGESEERLREIFERARESAPSIVFFDEVDALAGEREGGDMESRIVAQLLSLLDGLEARGDVIVIGATNRVDDLDPALRRPGRFDREIEIGVPDETGRREILAIHAEGVPLADDVDLDALAARTHGFVGADLRALLTEAAMTALRDADDRTAVTVGPADVDAALASVEPSAMREFVASVPETGFEDVGGLGDAKATLREAVEWPLANPELFAATNTEAPSGILLYGPPGTGKTMLARAVAHETDVNFVHVAGPELLDKYVGESERAVREVFERARESAPSIVFFDEIDAIAARRSGEDDVAERVVSQLLTELDGLADNRSLVVLAATNRREALDPALLRPGRLETHVEVPLPDHEARRAILAVHVAGKPLAENVDLDALAGRLEGATGADIAALCREASLRAIREAVGGEDVASARPEDVRIRPEHFEAALAALDRE